MDVEARVKSLADVEVSDIGQRYKMQEELGSGAQATVYKGQNKKSGGKVAIKVLELQELEDDELFDALRMEIGLLRQVSAPACPSRPHSWGPAGVPCAGAVGVGPGRTPIERASPLAAEPPVRGQLGGGRAGQVVRLHHPGQASSNPNLGRRGRPAARLAHAAAQANTRRRTAGPTAHTRPAGAAQECLSGGELFEHLLAKGPFKEDYALAIFAQARAATRTPHAAHTRRPLPWAWPEAHAAQRTQRMARACTHCAAPLLPAHPLAAAPSRRRWLSRWSTCTASTSCIATSRCRPTAQPQPSASASRPIPPARPHAPSPLQAENIVFAAKGSPVIKFIDFGGACTWTAEEGLTGLVGTPQYVAPEVVTGYGEDKPTDAPYGKGCGAPEQG